MLHVIGTKYHFVLINMEAVYPMTCFFRNKIPQIYINMLNVMLIWEILKHNFILLTVNTENNWNNLQLVIKRKNNNNIKIIPQELIFQV